MSCRRTRWQSVALLVLARPGTAGVEAVAGSPVHFLRWLDVPELSGVCLRPLPSGAQRLSSWQLVGFWACGRGVAEVSAPGFLGEVLGLRTYMRVMARAQGEHGCFAKSASIDKHV